MATQPATPVVSSPSALPPINLPGQLQSDIDINSILPSPETFDIVPSLHELLSRLLKQSDNPSDRSSYPEQQPLSPQQLQAEASAIRNKIRKAREAMMALPDMDRSIDQQEEEMRVLNEKIQKQKRVLQGLGGG